MNDLKLMTIHKGIHSISCTPTVHKYMYMYTLGLKRFACNFSYVICYLLCCCYFLIFHRSIIQVLLVDGSQTEIATVYSDSPGRTLYHRFEKRSGLPEHHHTLIHGAKVLRHNPSLGEQGIHNLSVIFVLPVMGKGGGKTRLGTCTVVKNYFIGLSISQ